MAGAQVSAGYAPPIGQPWGSLPILSQINEVSDLANNPDPNIAHDVTGIASLAPGPLGLGLSLLSSSLPGGWLDSVLGLGDFGTTLTAPSAVGTGEMSGINYTPGLQGNVPGTGLWGAVQDVGDAIGSGFSSLAAALGLGGSDSSTGDSGAGQGIGQKFGG